jgi:hypothetical protein
VEAFASDALILHPAPPSSTLRSHNAQCILNRPRHTSDAACCLDSIHPLLLLRPYASGWGLDLDAGEYRHLLAHHVWGDGHAPPAKQVACALAAHAKLNPSASAWIRQASNVITEKPYRAITAGEPDVLLN